MSVGVKAMAQNETLVLYMCRISCFSYSFFILKGIHYTHLAFNYVKQKLRKVCVCVCVCVSRKEVILGTHISSQFLFDVIGGYICIM